MKKIIVLFTMFALALGFLPAIPIANASTLVVTSTADSGLGTLRQALLDAQGDDTITFDSTVFPPASPAAIHLTTSLPIITQGNLTVDASNAGVILNGNNSVALGLEIDSDRNTIHGFQIVNFTSAGIQLSNGTQYNTIGGDRSIGSGPLGQGNFFSTNYIGIDLNASSNNILVGNNANSNDYGILLYSSSNNTLNDNTANYNNEYGIYLSSYYGEEGSNNNVLTNNTANSNDYGIYFDKSSSYNTLNSNTANSNNVGIYLDSSSNNKIYLNNFVGNTYNVNSSSSTNTWNSPHPIPYTYKGSSYTNYLGNYWGDYAGSDVDGDGIGDTPYSIDGDNDNYPLMETFETFIIGPSPTDTTPPNPVTDLTVSGATVDSVNLTWTAPGDDGNLGTASQYDIRYSTSPITESNWQSATQCSGEPVPQAAGNNETFTVTGLSLGTTYYFALKTADEVPNWSALSNAAVYTPTPTPPNGVPEFGLPAFVMLSIAMVGLLLFRRFTIPTTQK